MEIKFKKGDSVIIPEGCKAVINNGMVVFEKAKTNFKVGEVITCDTGEILLVKVGFGDLLSSFVHIGEDGKLWGAASCIWNPKYDWRLATEEEKQLLFDKMKEKGLRWNAEEKKVEEIKWQPQNGERYFFVNAYCETGSIICLENYIDELLEKACNQLRTKELAEKAAEAVRETLRRFHEENKIE